MPTPPVKVTDSRPPTPESVRFETLPIGTWFELHLGCLALRLKTGYQSTYNPHNQLFAQTVDPTMLCRPVNITITITGLTKVD
jgi:hypothetical protein